MDKIKKKQFINSFSKSKFELINKNKKLFLKKKISDPKKRDFESIQKNNFFNLNINIKNVKTELINISSFQDLKKKKYFISNYINGHVGDLILTNLGFIEINLLEKFIREYFTILQNKVKWNKFDKMIVINKNKPYENRIKILSEILSKIDTDNIYIKPKIRELINQQ